MPWRLRTRKIYPTLVAMDLSLAMLSYMMNHECVIMCSVSALVTLHPDRFFCPLCQAVTFLGRDWSSLSRMIIPGARITLCYLRRLAGSSHIAAVQQFTLGERILALQKSEHSCFNTLHFSLQAIQSVHEVGAAATYDVVFRYNHDIPEKLHIGQYFRIAKNIACDNMKSVKNEKLWKKYTHILYRYNRIASLGQNGNVITQMEIAWEILQCWSGGTTCVIYKFLIM